jgi:hypothetical protein
MVYCIQPGKPRRERGHSRTGRALPRLTHLLLSPCYRQYAAWSNEAASSFFISEGDAMGLSLRIGRCATLPALNLKVMCKNA